MPLPQSNSKEGAGELPQVLDSYWCLVVNNKCGSVRGPGMGKRKKALIVGGTAVVGIVTLRSVRKRRSKQSENDLREKKQVEPETPTEHAKAAVDHTRQAARKTKKIPPRNRE